VFTGVDLDTLMRRFEFTDELKAEKKSDEEKIITLDDVRNLNNKNGFWVNLLFGLSLLKIMVKRSYSYKKKRTTRRKKTGRKTKGSRLGKSM